MDLITHSFNLFGTLLVAFITLLPVPTRMSLGKRAIFEGSCGLDGFITKEKC